MPDEWRAGGASGEWDSRSPTLLEVLHLAVGWESADPIQCWAAAGDGGREVAGEGGEACDFVGCGESDGDVDGKEKGQCLRNPQ